MARLMKGAAFLSFLLAGVSAGLFFLGNPWVLPFAITFGTFFYHFAMRLLVGWILNRIMGNKADYTHRLYQLRPFEIRLYRKLQVKKWKHKMPTYDPSLFDPTQHSWEQIAQAMCQAEIVHSIIAMLSFLPLLAAIPFGAFPVFLITSLVSAGFDLSFVILQRFNRHRILRLIDKKARTQK